jgi:MGT family glycosyltransferase
MAAWGRVAADWLGLPHVSSNPLYPVGLHPSEAPRDQRLMSAESLASLNASRLAVSEQWGLELGSPLEVLANPGDLIFRYTTPEIVGLTGESEESWRFVGPMIETPPEDAEAPADPADDRPLVYMALGTLFNTRKDLFTAVLAGLADEPVRLIVSTGRRHSAQDLAPAPPNAVISEYVSSPTVLREAELHITHGGGGSVHESLWAGVPMLCLPQGADQVFWTQCVRELGAGERLTAETPERIREAVRRLLDDSATRASAREAGERLRAYDGPGIAVRSVEALLA